MNEFMSMVQMPLLIKVKMTKENYAKLIAEAAKRYCRVYLKKNYLYDGTYFILDVCDMDNYEIFAEAALVARFAEPTDEVVGLIYDGGCSFSVTDLQFINGGCFTEKKLDKKNPGGYDLYHQKKEAFLSRFPADETGKTGTTAADVLPPRNDVKVYDCLGMSYDTLDGFFEQNGYHVEEIYQDGGRVFLILSNSEERPEEILAQHYNCDKVYLFCGADHQEFPDQIMMLMINKEETQSSPEELHIPSAEETRQTTNTVFSDCVKKSCESMVLRINEAKAKGYRRTTLVVNTQDKVDLDDLERAVADVFVARGYVIRPTGMCGGVIQKTKDVCW